MLLHDGSKIIVERSFIRGGRHELTQGPPIKEEEISFTIPGRSRAIVWKSEYSEDVGRAEFSLLSLHILYGMAYVVTSPSSCFSYGKWGRPNPPYVLFKYDKSAWRNIPLTELPEEFKELNVVINVGNYDFSESVKKYNVIPVAAINELNRSLTQFQYKTILRSPIDLRGICPPPTGPDGLPLALKK